MRALLSIAVVLAAALPTAVLPTPAQAQARTWQLTEDSHVRFTCEGPQIRNAARGRFATVAGTITADPASLPGARGAVQVEMVSVTTWDASWDAMFRRAPFLDLEEHPHARFELRSVHGAAALTPGEWTRVRLHGAMRVHGVERELRIPARVLYTPASGDTPEELQVQAAFPLDWDDYGIAVPTGWTRRFAGDRASVEIRLHYRPQAS